MRRNDRIVTIVGWACFIGSVIIIIMALAPKAKANWICTPSGAAMTSTCHDT